MKTPIIDIIFEDYCPTPEYTRLAHSHEIERAERVVLRGMIDPASGEEALAALGFLVSKRLFTMGFQYAVRLMMECGAEG